MRCLALAQAWKRSGGSVTFLIPEGSSGIEQRIRTETFALEAPRPDQFANSVVNRVIDCNPQVAVLDGYGFGAKEQSTLSRAGILVLTVDDYGHATDYPVRWILNQNTHASPEMYARRGDDTRLLLGPSYALLRNEFLPWLGWKRSIPEKASKVLVTIGGSDPDNLSFRVLESLAVLARPDLQVLLVVGGSNPYLHKLESAAERSPLSVRIVRNAVDMPALMAWADIAISGAGGTSYELCYMGLPSLLFVIAENQRCVAQHLSDLSAVVNAGTAVSFDPQKFIDGLSDLIDSRKQRQVISERARDLVDGSGADRVRAALQDREVRLCALRETDCQLLFAWANDGAVRAASFHSAPVLWNDHQEWFAQKLRDPQSVIYIGEDRAGEPVGQVRFQFDGGRAILSVVVAPKFRGTGWGRELVVFSIRMLARAGSTRRVDAFVKPDNHASIRLFESAGFQRSGIEEVAGQPAVLFTWEYGSEPHAN